ncbi:DNA polymerase III PolC-type [anaerobic digester metagenome]
MEFRKVLEHKLQGRLREEHLRVLKVEYLKKHCRLRIFCVADGPLCIEDEECIGHVTDEILGGQVIKDIAVMRRNGDVLDTEEAIRGFLAEIFRKDPIAMNFFRDARLERSENELSFAHSNPVLVNHLQRKGTVELIEEFLREIYDMTCQIRLVYDAQAIPAQIALEEIPQPGPAPAVFAPASSVPKPAPPKPAPPPKPAGDDPVLYGKLFRDEPIPIADVAEGMYSVTVAGQIFKLEEKELRTGKILLTIYLTDSTSSIICKLFAKDKDEVPPIKAGMHVMIKGKTEVDLYMKEMTVRVAHCLRLEAPVIIDDAPVRRVELHAHTTMSTMDGMVSAGDLVRQAIQWGHEAIAITDHGVVQAFPEAMEAAGSKIKVLYGMEAYVVDDLTGICTSQVNVPFDGEYVVFDIETTGFSHVNDRIIEIGAAKVREGRVVERFSAFVDPQRPLPAKIIELTGITDSMVRGQKTIDQVLPEFLAFCGSSVLVAHNANFDMGFIRKNAKDLGLPFDNAQLDTVTLARYLYPELKRHRLDTIAKYLNIFMGSHHRAVDDAETTANILLRSFENLTKNGITDTAGLNADYLSRVDITKQMPDHVIILAKNQKGLKTLYELVSKSHLEHFQRNPRLPKSLLAASRENLILGSACTNSELYRAILDGRRPDIITSLADFYDYLEIQPVSNHAHLLVEDRCHVEQLKDINRRIVKLGKALGKPVVATGDVHMMRPEDAVFRHVLTYCQGFAGAGENSTPMPFRTTDEMLREFDYLGGALAREVVIDNTRRIAAMVEPILPIPKETFPPKMEGAEEDVRSMTLDKAYAIYGNPLPDIVQARVDRELKSIIGNGYAVLYLVAHKLVKKSLSDGYLVGSRGSVGSSLVATLMDITEVNGLPPHYVCPHCKHSEFFTDGSVSSGVDLPAKRCPACHTEYIREGHDIPFETFLGFEGDKEPDIDLNFSGDNQASIHKYCEVLFGEGFTFRAGTITTVAEKTAMGYVRKFLEEKNLSMTRAEMERLAAGCTGIKRSTGQHPGGIMVVPADNDIHNFCPVQRPADDTSTDIITTHFDYHSISGRLLKLDILGHDDPTVLRMLQDITGIDPKSLPLTDPKVLGLFRSTETLGVDPEALGSPVGTIGVPEFGTRFVRQMLMDTKPKSFADLVRVSGLSHGTDVWLNNAQYYIKNGDTDLEGCISLRDNIMLYLIQCGLPSKDAFFITERVRKGKGLKPEEEAQMRQYKVPEWYIESCKKIKYMFPKGHAVAYVTMAVRIAWYKVYYPLHYYATFFSVRAKDFDAEVVLKGQAAVKAKLDEIAAMGNEATPKDQNLAATLELVYEMFLRGYDFAPVDIYKSHGSKFIVADNRLIPPFSAVNGIGENAGLAIYEEAQKGEFFSKEDFKNRTRSTRTVMEALERLGCLNELGDTNQISFFG